MKKKMLGAFLSSYDIVEKTTALYGCPRESEPEVICARGSYDAIVLSCKLDYLSVDK